ncbi:hypothetical protein M422DRAFT_57355 [Sphaerobolus stellatus SS14]|nr:hypothetical protein M422DRAFT_57355 [Sphaerobolus stellatus SS14]
MGFTGLARWINAPTSGMEMINDNIMRNHGGIFRGKWHLSVKSYRSLGPPGEEIPGLVHNATERIMCAVTMNDNVFVYVEDPTIPSRSEYVTAEAEAVEAAAQSNGDIVPQPLIHPTHYRTTYITVNPPQALDLLLAQLRARWQSVRQATGQGRGQNAVGIGPPQVTIEGNVFAIGTDWLVRVGNVVLAGSAIRGMVIEAEYLPLNVTPIQSLDGASELLSNLLTSLLPRISDARTVAITISPGQWEDILFSEDSPEDEGTNSNEEIIDDIYVHGLPPPQTNKRNWQGTARDKRAAFLIIGALRSEGLL